jgi:hypothetical protein
MKAPINNNLPILVNDVIFNPENPENPDSKPLAAARIISNEDKKDSLRFGRRWVLKGNISCK